MSHPDPSLLPYRRCVGMMVLNSAGHVFVGRRIHIEANEAWQMPQGGIDDGETPLKAARRELREEAGTDVLEGPETGDEILDDLARLRYQGIGAS